jgi:hypothetical protein
MASARAAVEVLKAAFYAARKQKLLRCRSAFHLTTPSNEHREPPTTGALTRSWQHGQGPVK